MLVPKRWSHYIGCAKLTFLVIGALLFSFNLHCAVKPTIATNAKPNQVTDSASELSDEAQVIQAVKEWYIDDGYEPPERIVVVRRTGNLWRVRVGPEAVENGLDVDANSLKVVKIYPGY